MDKTQQVINIIFSSTRVMPARFNSNGERSESFCVDFSDLSAEDEAEMAAEAWYGLDYFFKDGFVIDSARAEVCRCGEDIMIGAYIITRLGAPEQVDELRDKIILLRFGVAGLSKINGANTADIQNYLVHCMKYGRDTALFGSSNTRSVVLASRMMS